MKVSMPSKIYKVFKSVGKVVTMSTWKGEEIIRKYAVPKLKRSDVIDTIDTIHAITKDKWRELSDIEKEEWNNTAKEGYLTGFQLYEQESWKQAINSNLNKSILGTARLGGSIKSGKGAICGYNQLGIGFANGDRPL